MTEYICASGFHLQLHMNLILFGPPGVGKGTQATRLASSYDLHHISTGDMFRTAIAAGTPLGLTAKHHVESGGLVPDEVIIGLVREVLASDIEQGKGFLLDGFPRTIEQARSLDGLFEELGIDNVRIIMLDAHENELVQRMLKRGEETGRKDDTEETIRHRLRVYEKQTQPVKTYYEARRAVEMINGLGTVEEITGRIMDQLAKSPQQ